MKRHYQYINISLNIILLLSEGSFFLRTISALVGR